MFTGTQAAYDSAVNFTQNHGTIVAVRLPAQPTSINCKKASPQQAMEIIYDTVVNTGSRQELADCLDLAARHDIRPKIER